jgi:hypothetical protein
MSKVRRPALIDKHDHARDEEPHHFSPSQEIDSGKLPSSRSRGIKSDKERDKEHHDVNET